MGHEDLHQIKESQMEKRWNMKWKLGDLRICLELLGALSNLSGPPCGDPTMLRVPIDDFPHFGEQ